MNSNKEESQILFKNKRDEYIVEIRKKKNKEQLTQKRMKLMQQYQKSSEQNKNDPLFQYTNIKEKEKFHSFAMDFRQAMKDKDQPALTEVLGQIRRSIAASDDPPIKELVFTGIVPSIIKLIDQSNSEFEQVLIEATWIITNISSGSGNEVDILVENDAIPRAISLLGHTSDKIKDNCIWILANICGESLDYRDMVLENGVVQKLVDTVENKTFELSFLSNVAWFMSNLCRGKRFPALEKVQKLFPIIKYFFTTEIEQILVHSLWTVNYLAEPGIINIQAVLEMGIAPKLVRLLGDSEPLIVAPALRAVGNILVGSDVQAEPLIEAGVIEQLANLMDSPMKLFRKEACWAISNILAGPYEQIQKVFEFEHGRIINKIFDMVYNEEMMIVKECIHGLLNSTSNAVLQQIDILIDKNLFGVIVDTIEHNKNDATLVLESLEALENTLQIIKKEYSLRPSENPYLEIFGRVGGVKMIEDLQGHENNDVYRIVDRIINDHFDYV